MKDNNQDIEKYRKLIEFINFIENVSAKIHGVSDELDIYDIIDKEFGMSKKYSADVFLLTDNKSKLKIALLAISSKKIKIAEKIANIKLKDFKIDSNKIEKYSKVLFEGKTIYASSLELAEEIFSKPIAYLIIKTIGYIDRISIITPLYKNKEIIGLISVSSPELAEQFTESVKSFSMHISTALELAERNKEQKKAEEEKARLLVAIEQSKDAINIYSSDARIVYTNNAMDKLFGYEKGELTGKPISILNAGRTSEAIVNKVISIVKNKGYWEGEVNNKRKDGKKFTSYARVFVSKDANGKIMDYITTQYNIEEEKKAEKEKEKLYQQLVHSEKMGAIGTLTAGVAHEFNNLTTIIRGTAELGGMEFSQDRKASEYFKTIVDTADRSSEIVRNLATFSRTEADRKEYCSIVETIERVLSVVKDQLNKQNIKIITRFGRVPKILINESEIQQVILNIIINARDAIIPKEGKITLKARFEKGEVVITISDTGKGIIKKNVGKIFEPFYTTKGALGGNADISGTGLGLSVSYGIVKRHGGTIRVESKKGKGTTLILRLPVRMTGKNRKHTKKEVKEVKKGTKARNILIVDDEKEICDMLTNYLVFQGYDVKSTMKSSEIVELQKKEFFDVVLLDLLIPGSSGTDLLELIKKNSPKTKVIVITGKLLTGHLKTGLKQKGVSGFVQKPFEMDDIIKAIS